MDQEQAMKEIQEHLEILDNTKNIYSKNGTNEMTENIPYTTYKTWIYNGKFPLTKVFFHPNSTEILEHMLMLAIRIKQEQEVVRLIDVKRAMLEVEECYEIKDKSLFLRSVAKVKSMLNFVSTDREKMKQTRLAI